MKNLIRVSSFAFLTLALASCSRDTDLVNEESSVMAQNSKNQEKISLTKTEVLAESNKISSLSAGQSLVLNHGNANIHLDLQYDGNLVLYASPIQWFGPAPYPVKWASNTTFANGTVQPYLSAQTDGNLVLYKNAPYNSSNAIWASNTDTGNVSDPKFKLQVIKKTNALNSGSPKYYATFILEGNNSERHEITVSEITNIY
ncbi:hypothetical protein [Chryseobacterium taeanense]|uniref:hypothetical protein n=1 Tax=Chryseobacterium taeanense TaxID=311334 RepID=UPI0035AE9F66